MNDNHYQDEQRHCRECGCVYTWEAGEQRYYSDRSLAPPSHCPGCRKRRRAVIGEPRRGIR